MQKKKKIMKYASLYHKKNTLEYFITNSFSKYIIYSKNIRQCK